MKTFQFRVTSILVLGRFLTACVLAGLVFFMPGCDRGGDADIDLRASSVDTGLTPSSTADAKVDGNPVSFKPAELPAAPEIAVEGHGTEDTSENTAEASDVEREQVSDDMDFFSAPRVSVESQQVIEATEDSAPLRLIGFISAPSESGVIEKAILKLGDKMLTLGAGELADGIEILEIKNRSVTIQRDRQRRTLGLFDQPLVNPVLVRQSSRSRKSLRSRSTSNRGASKFDNRGQSATRQLPPLPTGTELGPSDAFAARQFPEHARGIDRNEMPEMPELPEMPEIELPGLDLP